MKLKLKLVERDLCIAKFEAGTTPSLPATGFCSFTRTYNESTLVCHRDALPAGALQVNDDWAGFEVEGPLDFSLVGILAELSAVLAREQISLCAVSTFDTDWILVKNDKAGEAATAWHRAGHSVEIP